jgi:hypothetical protein
MATIWLGSIADLLINLSAGWFGVAIILPISVRRQSTKPIALLINVQFGIFALIASVFLRSRL